MTPNERPAVDDVAIARVKALVAEDAAELVSATGFPSAEKPDEGKQPPQAKERVLRLGPRLPTARSKRCWAA
jgi:hypothetical protein